MSGQKDTSDLSADTILGDADWQRNMKYCLHALFILLLQQSIITFTASSVLGDLISFLHSDLQQSMWLTLLFFVLPSFICGVLNMFAWVKGLEKTMTKTYTL